MTTVPSYLYISSIVTLQNSSVKRDNCSREIFLHHKIMLYEGCDLLCHGHAFCSQSVFKFNHVKNKRLCSRCVFTMLEGIIHSVC